MGSVRAYINRTYKGIFLVLFCFCTIQGWLWWEQFFSFVLLLVYTRQGWLLRVKHATTWLGTILCHKLPAELWSIWQFIYFSSKILNYPSIISPPQNLKQKLHNSNNLTCNNNLPPNNLLQKFSLKKNPLTKITPHTNFRSY